MLRSTPEVGLKATPDDFRKEKRTRVVNDETDIILLWRGTDTVHAVQRAIDEDRLVEVTLPNNMHHVLFAHFHPQETGAGAKVLDVTGGPELLETIADIAGLKEWDELVEPARDHGYLVQLSNPALIVLRPKTSG